MVYRVDHATTTLLNILYKYLDGKKKKHAMLLFADFSSGFKAIQTHLVVRKLVSSFNLDLGIVKWVLDFFLTLRPLSVSVNGVLSQK